MEQDELAAALAEAERIRAEVNSGSSAALVPTSVDDPDAIRAHLAADRKHALSTMRDARVASERVQELVAARKRAIEESVAAQKAELDRLMREAEIELAPLQKQIERLGEGIATLHLYLGSAEEIVPLAEGDRAPADTPISIRQMVLGMDEESLLSVDSGGMDFRSVDDFDRWVTASPAHLDQLLPEQKGVVAVIPRMADVKGKEKMDLFTLASEEEANKKTWFLIRNGENVWRIATAFKLGRRLVPTRDEFRRVFTTTRGVWDAEGNYATVEVEMEPGSREWIEVEERAGKRERHYMQVAAILQGLIDRTKVFHPLPADRVNLGSQATYDTGVVRMITDEENVLGTGRPRFRDWLASKNSELVAGMRIVGRFNGLGRTGYGRDAWDDGRVYPASMDDRPETGVPYTVATSSNGRLAVRFPRTYEVYYEGHYEGWRWVPGGLRVPETPGTVYVEPSDDFFICIDSVTEEELSYYLNSRSERSNYIKMIPLLRAAAEALRAEREAEAPFREMLVGVLARETDGDLDAARAAVPGLVSWWKFTNASYRPLVDADGADERIAVNRIVEEYRAALAAPRDDAAEAKMLDHIRATADDDLMMVARRRDGGYVALAPSKRKHPAKIADPNVYVTLYTIGKTPRASLYYDEWKVVSRAQVAKWRVIWADDRWSQWELMPHPGAYLSDPEIDQILDHAREAISYEDGELAAITFTAGSDFYSDHVTAWASRGMQESHFGKSTPEYNSRTITWRRNPDRSLETLSDSRRQTDSRVEPWSSYALVLEIHEEVIAPLREAVAQQQAAESVRWERERVAEVAVASLADAWTARWEGRQQAAYIEEFLDPELEFWTDHLKTVKRPTNPLDYRGADRTKVLDAAKTVVKAGGELDGRPLAEVLEEARRLGWSGTVEDVDGLVFGSTRSQS